MRKKTVLFFVFDGFADWEAAYALVGIRKSGAYQLRTIALDRELKTSMGGMAVLPDLDFLPETDLKDIDDSNTALLILPGGTAWEDKANREIAPLVKHCVAHGIPVAAICGATIFLADLGMLDTIEHTSNDLEYLSAMSPRYRGQRFYQYQSCVGSPWLITASGTASLEFAIDIFETLGIGENDRLKEWFQYFQNKAVNFKHPDSEIVTA